MHVTVVSELFGADADQPAIVSDQLTVGELLREIQLEFELPSADYQLRLARTGATLLADQTLMAQAVQPDDQLLLQVADGAASPAPAAAPLLDVNLIYALLRAAGGQEFPIIRSLTVIGRPNRQRSISPDIDLSDLDPELTVSRPHAHIIREAAAYFVVSQKPDNPVILNDAPVPAGDRQPLHDGDWLRLGNVKLQFVLRMPANR